MFLHIISAKSALFYINQITLIIKYIILTTKKYAIWGVPVKCISWNFSVAWKCFATMWFSAGIVKRYSSLSESFCLLSYLFIYKWLM